MSLNTSKPTLSPLIVAYDAEHLIGAAVKQWDDVLVLVSKTPWYGKARKGDKTAAIARRAGAKVVEGHWPTEHEQRNAGLEMLADRDLVIIADADEFYTEQDRKVLAD